MIDSKIVKLYNIMDANEKRDLQLWLNNKQLWSKKKGDSQDILYLHECLAKYAKRTKKLEESTQKFKKDKLSQLCYQLFHITENFLLMNWLSKKADKKQHYAIQKQMLTLAFYQEKELTDNSKYIGDLSKLIDFKLKDVNNLLNKSKPSHTDHYLQLHKLNHHLYYGLNTTIWQEGKQYLQALLLHLDTFYITTKMRYFTEALYRAKITDEEFALPDLKWIQQKAIDVTTVLNKAQKGNPLLELYQLCFELAINTNKDNLLLLSTKITEHADLLDVNELGSILSFASNYSAFITRKEGIDLIKLQYKMHKLGLEKSVFLSNGLLQPIVLINYAYLCSEETQAQEIDLALKKYQFRIENDFKESTTNLCLAYKYFTEIKFEKALEWMNKVSKRNLQFYLGKKLLQIKCCYELKDYIVLEEERNNLLRFLRNNKDYSIYEYLYNFTQLVRDLANPDFGKTELIEKVKMNTVERPWLLRKINEK